MTEPTPHDCQTLPLESIANGISDNHLVAHPTAILDAKLVNPLGSRSDPASSAGTLSQGIAAAQQGNQPLARLHLEQAIKSEPDNPDAWLWFAWVADSPAATISALEQAKLLGSNSDTIQQGLSWARGMQNFDLPQTNPESQQDPINSNMQVAIDLSVNAKHGPGTTSLLPDLDESFDDTDCPPYRELAEPGEPAHLTSQEEQVEHNDDDTVDPISRELDEMFARIQPSAVSDDAPFGRTGEAENAHQETTDQDSPSSRSVSTDATRQDSRPTILAIDDSATIRSLVRICLEKSGYNVVTANDGVEALKPLKTCQPSLILLDINMPRLNGYQLCKLVKKNVATRSVPVIMLSGKDGMFDKLRGKMCGCDDYITKPFEATKLQKKVAQHLAMAATKS